ncbi:MAG: hypothetical protein M1826_005813 [Phylliscum demangeonii]|nr:MAG: hypothetical protein M1826_005813 [Phylliscum demangeonii]
MVASQVLSIREPLAPQLPEYSALETCLTQRAVPVSLRSHANFTQLSKPFNLRLQYEPAAIALAETPQHVSDAILCAAAADVKVQAKSGGHSYGSFSLGGKNGSLVISLEAMQDVRVDNATGIAKVGGGVRLGNLALAIYEQGKRALPHGTCPGVGVGGHFTHGGFGYQSRIWGLAMDSIVGLDVALANGSSVHASSTSHPALFYVLRGAADSFGIVTTFHLQTFPAPSTVVEFRLYISDILALPTVATDAILHVQNFARNASVVDRRMTFSVYTTADSVSINGLFFGSLEEFNGKIAPELFRGMAAPRGNESRLHEVDWITALTWVAGSALPVPRTGYQEHDTFVAKSLVVPESRPLSSSALHAYFSYILHEGRQLASPWFSIISLYGGPDSQIRAQPASAYPHRSALWVVQNYARTATGQPPLTDDLLAFVAGLSDALAGAGAGAGYDAYLNYVDPDLTAAEAHRLYYGPALYDTPICHLSWRWAGME